jgi:hypothetical protein
MRVRGGMRRVTEDDVDLLMDSATPCQETKMLRTSPAGGEACDV